MKKNTEQIYKKLKKAHPKASIELNFSNPFELLVATILSAQCTDVRVNQVTADLFKKYKKPKDYIKRQVAATKRSFRSDKQTENSSKSKLSFAKEKKTNQPISELEEDIRPTGFFRQKAKSIMGVMEALIKTHNNKVPGNMKELVKMPGVGRKTANVILGNAFDIPGIVVDTHVSRVSRRIGLTSEKKPEKIEADLSKLFNEKRWVKLSHLLIFQGRYICKARKPVCDKCSITDLCDYYNAERGKAVP